MTENNKKPIFKFKHFEIRVMNKENPSERALNFKVNVLNTLKNSLIKIFPVCRVYALCQKSKTTLHTNMRKLLKSRQLGM